MATNAEQLRSRIKVCMFDQYGTVVDMQGGLVKVATPYLQKKGWTGNPNSFVTWWRRTHFENSMIDALLHREHTPYRAIGFAAVCSVLDRSKIAYTDDEVRELVAAIERLECFPEVPEALARLQTRYKLVVLFQRGSRHAGNGKALPQGALRPGDLGGRGEQLQAACRDLSQGGGTRRRRDGRGAVRRQPRSSTASAPRRRACAPPSSTAASAPSCARPTAPTSPCPP